MGFLGIVASWGGDMRERKGFVELEGTGCWISWRYIDCSKIWESRVLTFIFRCK